MGKTFELWVGAYADQDEVGITRLQFDTESGQLTKLAEFSGIVNPSFLTSDKLGRYLHSVSEVLEGEGSKNGELVTFEIPKDPSQPLTEVVSHDSLGGFPCFVMLDPTESYIAVANYMGPSVTIYGMTEDGIPGPANVRFRHTGTGTRADRQEMAHPHSAVFSPDGEYMFVPDLGLDKIMVYKLEAAEQLWVGHDAVNVTPGAGPRHLRFHPSGKSAYVVNELDCTVTRFTYDEPGVLVKQESLTTLPDSFTGESNCAELVVSPDGRFVYASNRGHDSIAIMKLNEETGQLEAAGFISTRGRTPRNFAITPDGQWLLAANQDSNNLVLFKIDVESGYPIYADMEVAIHKPVCVHIR